MIEPDREAGWRVMPDDVGAAHDGGSHRGASEDVGDGSGRDIAARDVASTGAQTAAEARAEYEARRAETRAARESRLAEAFPDGDPGAWLTTTSVVTTVVFTVVTMIAAVDPARFMTIFFVVAVALFVVGMGAFAMAIFGMALRSRDDLLSIAGVFFLSGSAPRSVQVRMIGSLAVQVVTAVVGAAVRPFTPLAAGTLVPMLGLGMVGLWAVRYGHFEAHDPGAISGGQS